MSIVEIARFAGVSKTTVSRVINELEYVHPEKKILVERAVRMLGYVAPKIKRGPKLGMRRAKSAS